MMVRTVDGGAVVVRGGEMKRTTGETKCVTDLSVYCGGEIHENSCCRRCRIPSSLLPSPKSETEESRWSSVGRER